MDWLDVNNKLIAGDPDAFKGLFQLTYGRLVSYCRLFMPDRETAEDLVQECFVKLWDKRTTIKPSRSVESLLFVMVRHRCLNYLRDEKIKYSGEDIASVEETDLQHLFELDFLGTEQRSVEEELIEAIRLEIKKLPKKRRMVFEKSKLEGLKNREIAAQLGISIKAVEKHLALAKAQIQKELKAKYSFMVIMIALLLR